MSICIEPVRLRAYGRNIDLEFKDRITLVSGNSGTGKTLIFELLNDIQMKDKDKYTCINKALLNRTNMRLSTFIKKATGKLIVIDNADIILTDNDKKIINSDNKHSYLLFARNQQGLNITENSLTELQDDGRTISLRYRFSNNPVTFSHNWYDLQ